MDEEPSCHVTAVGAGSGGCAHHGGPGGGEQDRNQEPSLSDLLPPARPLFQSYKPPQTVLLAGKHVFKTPASGCLEDLNHKHSQLLGIELGLTF